MVLVFFDYLSIVLNVACLIWGVHIFLHCLIYSVSNKDWYILGYAFVMLGIDILLGCLLFDSMEFMGWLKYLI